MTYCKRCETFFGDDDDFCPECEINTAPVPTCEQCDTDLMRHHQRCPGCGEPVAQVVSGAILDSGYFEGNISHMIGLER